MKSILLTALILLVSWPTAIAQTAKITKSVTPLATTPPALPDTPIIWDNAGTLTLRDDTGVDWLLSDVDFTSLSVAEITALTQAIDFTQLTVTQVTDLTQAIDYSQLTAAQITALETALGLSDLHPDDDVEGVTGTAVDNTDARNPIINVSANDHPDDDVEGVTGTAVDNTDARNPIINVSANDHPDDDVEGVTGTAVDNTDVRNPIINVSANDHPDDDVEGVTGTAVDNTDPRNPIIALTPTNLAYSASPTNGIVTSSDGTNATLPLATATNAGLITPAEKANIHADDDVEGVTGTAVDNTDVRNPIINLVDEVIENAGALSGAAPVGAQFGIDTTTGDRYYVSGGNWAIVPSVSSPDEILKSSTPLTVGAAAPAGYKFGFWESVPEFLYIVDGSGNWDRVDLLSRIDYEIGNNQQARRTYWNGSQFFTEKAVVGVSNPGTFTPDLSASNLFAIDLNNTSATINAPTGVVTTTHTPEVSITISNSGTGTFIFDPIYKYADGTALGTINLPVNTKHIFKFVSTTRSGGAPTEYRAAYASYAP